MPVYREEDILGQAVMNTAMKMLAAARTAPKGKGQNTLEMFIAQGETLELLAKKMTELDKRFGASFFSRDASNLSNSKAAVLIGTRIKPLGLNEMCQLCGFKNCTEKEKHPDTPCVFNTGDLNLAVGSAVAVAAADFIDNRIMFSLGKAAVELGLFKQDIKIAFGIPLAAKSKNPFFDRK